MKAYGRAIRYFPRKNKSRKENFCAPANAARRFLARCGVGFHASLIRMSSGRHISPVAAVPYGFARGGNIFNAALHGQAARQSGRDESRLIFTLLRRPVWEKNEQSGNRASW